MLNIWSSLAERYNRRLDEDDIFDIRTGELIKDRGVVNELPKRCNFGDLADREEINTDPGSEAADNVSEDEEDGNDDDEDEEDVEETRASSPSDGLVAPKLTRLAPLRPATSSSDAEDLREFLKAEAIRRELDGGDDSSEEEFSALPPRSTPVRLVVTPSRKILSITRAKYRLPNAAPQTDNESEDEFAAFELDKDVAYRGYHRARRSQSPKVPDLVPSPPPRSSSPAPSSSFSLPSSPLLSRTPLGSNVGPQKTRRFCSPTPKRQPVASTSRKTLEETLDEVDFEFPPPPPRAPSVFANGSNPGSIIDLSLSDDGKEDAERSKTSLPAKATVNPKLAAPETRMAKKTSAQVSKKLIPYVLIEKKPPVRAAATPAPALPTRHQIRSVLKRKRRVSSEHSTGEEHGNHHTGNAQRPSSPVDNTGSNPIFESTTPEVTQEVPDRGNDRQVGTLPSFLFFLGQAEVFPNR